MTRCEMTERYGDGLVFLTEDYYDQAILGVTNDMPTGAQRIVYDMDKMIEVFCDKNACDIGEAIEFLEFNTWGAYVGEATPVFVQRKL